jgi:hypothetical protein
VRASLTAVVFSIRKWSIEGHDCVIGVSTSLSLVVVLMDRAMFQMADVIVLDRTLRPDVFDEEKELDNGRVASIPLRKSLSKPE